jgi:hypothetical protein
MEVQLMYRRIAALGGAAVTAAAIAAPAAAQAATISSPVQCAGGVATQLSAPLVGSGFTPNSTVTISANGVPFATAPADAAGNFSATPRPPAIASLRRNQQTFQITASDSSGVAAGPSPLTVTRWNATLPAHARANKRVMFRVFGFVPGKRVYLFVRRHGHTLGRFSIGKAKGPCGDTSRRLPYMPVRHHTSGTYRYFFEQRRHFSAGRHVPRIRLTIIISRVLV